MTLDTDIAPSASPIPLAPQPPAQAPGRPTIAAIIVTWRTGPRLFACLAAALAASDIDEVIVVDNGNPREVRARLHTAQAACDKLEVICGHGNIGFGAGCNLGAKRTKADRLLFLNPDAVIPPGAAQALAEAGEAAPARPWIAGGRIVDLSGREQRGGRRGAITPWSAFVEATGLTRLAKAHPKFAPVHLETAPEPDRPHATGAVSGAFMMIRADDFSKMDGFDAGYFFHVEDVDICRRAREAGGAVVYHPHAISRHEGATSAINALKVGWFKGRGFARYFQKFAPTRGHKLAYRLLSPAIISAALIHAIIKSNKRTHKNSAD